MKKRKIETTFTTHNKLINILPGQRKNEDQLAKPRSQLNLMIGLSANKGASKHSTR